MEETAIQKIETAPLAATGEAANVLLGIISAAVQSPDIDAEKVERLLVVYQTVLGDKRRTAFYMALARLQAELPQIRKTGRIVDSKGGLRRYAKLEDIAVAIKPILEREGFAFSFNEKSVGTDGKLFEISCTLSHKDGHSETKNITVPFDASQFRTPIQSRGSTQSYAHRYLIKMHLNIVERGEDDDGSGATAKPITKEQAANLRKQLAEIKMQEAGFLRYMRADKIEMILAGDWQKAMNLLETKRSQGAK